MNENLARIVAIEYLTAAQGIEFRKPLQTSGTLIQAVERLRSRVPMLEQDRYLAVDLESAAQLVMEGAVADFEELPALD